MNTRMRKILVSTFFLFLGLLIFPQPGRPQTQVVSDSLADTTDIALPDSSSDTTRAAVPDAVQDSIIESTKDDVAAILKFMHGEDADTADTALSPKVVILPPGSTPGAGFAGKSHSFTELSALPHVSFSDHLLPWLEFDVFSATEYGTERRFLYHGLSPLPVDVSIDGVSIDLRRPTFPQTMAPDLMMIPPYLLASLSEMPPGTGGRPGRSVAVSTNDSLFVLP